MTDLFVHRRREIKYLVDAARLAAFHARVSRLLVADSHGGHGGDDGYINHSIYFDGPGFPFYVDKLEGHGQRVKPRLRFYRQTVDGAPSAMFLELKHRDGPFVAKRRTAVTEDLVRRLITGHAAGRDEDDDGVLSTYAYMSRRFDLRPAVAVRYHRSAFTCPHHPRLRVTYDRRLHWSESWAPDAGPEAFRQFGEPTDAVIEIKYDGMAPGWLIDTLAALELEPQSYSKYATALEAAHAWRSLPLGRPQRRA